MFSFIYLISRFAVFASCLLFLFAAIRINQRTPNSSRRWLCYGLGMVVAGQVLEIAALLEVFHLDYHFGMDSEDTAHYYEGITYAFWHKLLYWLDFFIGKVGLIVTGIALFQESKRIVVSMREKEQQAVPQL